MDDHIININFSEIPTGLIELPGTYKYSTRKASTGKESFDLIKRYYLTSAHCTPFVKSTIVLAEEQFADYTQSLTRYFEIIPGIFVDRYNALEMIGAMSYTKKYNLVYSFHDKLDYALAYLFKAPSVLEVRNKLENNCQEFGITYEELSYAFCTMNKDMISKISLQVFVNITELLDLTLLDILESPQSSYFIFGNQILDLTSEEYTPESRVTLFLLTKIGHFFQYYINSIINCFANNIKPFITSRDLVVVSKGPCNVVITSIAKGKLPTILFKLVGIEDLRIAPKTILEIGVN